MQLERSNTMGIYQQLITQSITAKFDGKAQTEGSTEDMREAQRATWLLEATKR